MTAGLAVTTCCLLLIVTFTATGAIPTDEIPGSGSVSAQEDAGQGATHSAGGAGGSFGRGPAAAPAVLPRSMSTLPTLHEASASIQVRGMGRLLLFVRVIAYWAAD